MEQGFCKLCGKHVRKRKGRKYVDGQMCGSCHQDQMDITGQRFGSLTAVRRLSPTGSQSVRWVFACDCGNETSSIKWQVTGGLVKQCAACGHLKTNKANTKLGISRSREYHRFNQAKARCTCPTNARWAEYGGRGIEWRFESYEQAYRELGPCPEDLTLDRIDNNGHYEPGNVRWATWEQQFKSRRPWNWRQRIAAETEITLEQMFA